MGLAASQARLLTLTSRLNDLELKAMVLSNRKLTMTAKSGNASIAYNQALTAAAQIGPSIITTTDSATNTNTDEYTTLKIKEGDNYVNFNYNTLRELGYEIAPKGSDAILPGNEDPAAVVDQAETANEAGASSQSENHAASGIVVNGSVQDVQVVTGKSKRTVDDLVQPKVDVTFNKLNLNDNQPVKKVLMESDPDILEEVDSKTRPAYTSVVGSSQKVSAAQNKIDGSFTRAVVKEPERVIVMDDAALVEPEVGEPVVVEPVVVEPVVVKPVVVKPVVVEPEVVKPEGEAVATEITYESNEFVEEAKNNSEALVYGLMNNLIGIYKDGVEVSLSDVGISDQKDTSTQTSTQTIVSEHLDYSARDAARSAAEASYQGKLNKLKVEENAIDMQMKTNETQYKAASTEFESVKTLIKENTERGFSLFS